MTFSVCGNFLCWEVFFFLLYLFICLFWENEREREHEQMGRGRERDKERIPNRLQAISTEPDARLDLMKHKIITWAKINSQSLNQLSHPSALALKFSLSNNDIATSAFHWLIFVWYVFFHSFIPASLYYYLGFFKLFILRERERERETVEGSERGKERTPSRLHTASTDPMQGLNPQTVGSWPSEPRSRVRHSTSWATRCPLILLFWSEVLIGST